MAGAWTTITILDFNGAQKAMRVWDVDGTGDSGYEFAHADDPDNLAQYETVAASQTDQVMGGAGAAGDYLKAVLIVPATTGAGTVSIKDGSGSAINIFVSGTLGDLRPIWIPIGIKSTSGAWKITTGANVSAIGIGRFSA